MQKASSPGQRVALSSAQMVNHPTVSVVITTKNEEKNIENCLRSLGSQTFKNIELIVVDNFSKDNTVDIAKRYTTKVYSKGPERSSQRNYGARLATSEYLLYLDADMILSPNVIEECVEKCEREGVDALYIPERIVGEGFWIKVRDFERGFYTGTVIDAVRFVRKNLFEQVKGFDETLIGPEDWDFDRKIREIGRTAIVDVPLYHNENSFDMKRYLKKKDYYAKGIQNYARKWGSHDPEITKQIGLWYRVIGVFTEKDKWKNLLRHPLFMIGMYYLKLRVAIGFRQNAK